MKFLLHVASGEREQSKTWGLIQQLSFFQEIQKGQIGCPWPWNRFIPTHKWNPKTRWPPKILVSRDTVVHNSPEYGRIYDKCWHEKNTTTDFHANPSYTEIAVVKKTAWAENAWTERVRILQYAYFFQCCWNSLGLEVVGSKLVFPILGDGLTVKLFINETSYVDWFCDHFFLIWLS